MHIVLKDPLYISHISYILEKALKGGELSSAWGLRCSSLHNDWLIYIQSSSFLNNYFFNFFHPPISLSNRGRQSNGFEILDVSQFTLTPVIVKSACQKVAFPITALKSTRRGGVEVAGWTVDQEIRVRFPTYRVWAL